MEETRTIVTPQTKTEVVIKTVLSGADQRSIENAIMAETEYVTEGEKQRMIMKGTAVQAGASETIRRLVVSVNGEGGGDMLTRVMSLPAGDADFVQEEVAKVDGGLSPKKDESSKSSTKES